MKTWFFTLTFIIAYTAVTFSQQVNNKNWTLVHERTATWCPFCGTWGWSMKDEIFKNYSDKNLIFLAVHHSGDLLNQTSSEFGNNFAGSGQPIFYMDGDNLNVNSGNISARIADIKTAMDFKATQSAFAGVGIDAALNSSNKTLTVKAKVEFLEAVEGGDYFLGLYLVEDVLNIQASISGTPLHRNVLRQSLLPATFGKSLKTGAITKGTIFNVDATLPNVTATRDKIKVVGIIWNKVGTKHIFFNANMVNVGIPASVEFEEDVNNDLLIIQNESKSIMVDMKNIVLEQDAILNVTDISGRTAATHKVYRNDSNRVVTLTGDFTPGIHIVTLISDKKRISKKVVIY